jgi:hypothetical protein
MKLRTSRRGLESSCAYLRKRLNVSWDRIIKFIVSVILLAVLGFIATAILRG